MQSGSTGQAFAGADGKELTSIDAMESPETMPLEFPAPTPSTGTVDDDDEPEDEHESENEAPYREKDDATELPEEFER
jgi:hypothetical protein